MDEEKIQKMYVATLLQIYYGKNPTPVGTYVSLPNESMEQLAGRLDQFKKQQRYKDGAGYQYVGYLGELTHQLPPPPPPEPVRLMKIEKIPVAVPKKAVAAPKLKSIKPA